MLTARLYGGLGNQLFQLAAAETIAKQSNRPLYIQELTNWSTHTKENYFESIFKHWKQYYYGPAGFFVPVREKNFVFKDWKNELEHFKWKVSMDGYFQNWRYVPKDFCSKLTFDTSVAKKYPMLTQSVFLHIRGGDYVNHWLHDVKLDNYYEEAIKLFPDSHFYVFTNDIEYAKNKPFMKNIRHSYVFENEVDSLYLMSIASAGICANSSFSWWGAYINPNRKIVMPNKWYNDMDIYTDGYYFNGVTVLDV
jgi:hypothetical protein